MLKNQSHTMGSASILRRFEPVPLGSSSTSAAAGVAGAAQGVLVWAISSCVRSGVCLSWSPQARPLQADTVRELVVMEEVLLQSMFPELLPAGASGGLLPFDWWPTQAKRQGNGGPLGPRHRARIPDQLTKKIAC